MCAGRQYGSQVEESYRYQTFLSNVKQIELHNAKFQNGQKSYWMGINQFADMVIKLMLVSLPKFSNKRQKVALSYGSSTLCVYV